MVAAPLGADYSCLEYLSRVAPRDSMFRRVIAAILMFFVLGYATVWAFEWPSADIAQHAHGTGHADSIPQVDDEACDHCCHASAHLIGLAQRGQPSSPIVTAPPLVNGAVVFVSRSIDPLLRPPQP